MVCGLETFNPSGILKDSTSETDLEIARPLLATLFKNHRAAVDNYVTTEGRLRMLTPKEIPKGGLLIALKRSFDKLNGLAGQTFRALKIIDRAHHYLTRHYL